MFDAKKVKDACVQWIRDWFEENGPGCNAVIGISGGKDSSVVAGLCVEALGVDRVIGVTMPNGVQPDIDDSIRLINHLGIKRYDVNIGAAYDALMAEVELKLGHEASAQTRINMAPRLRMTALYAVSQSNNGRVANTCNLSEDWVGYSTRYGDAAGDFSPLGGLTVQSSPSARNSACPWNWWRKPRPTASAARRTRTTSGSPTPSWTATSAPACAKTPTRRRSSTAST